MDSLTRAEKLTWNREQAWLSETYQGETITNKFIFTHIMTRIFSTTVCSHTNMFFFALNVKRRKRKPKHHSRCLHSNIEYR